MSNVVATNLLKNAQQWEITTLRLRDGWPLRVAFWKAATPTSHYVLMLPGLGEFIEKRSLRAEEWAARGYQAVTFDWRGQGGSGRMIAGDPRKIHIDNFQTYIEDLGEVIEKVWQPRVGKAFAVWDAHSTGAHIALRALARLQPTQGADLLIVTAPLVDVKTPPLPGAMIDGLTRLASALAPQAWAYGQKPYRRADLPFETTLLTSSRANYEGWRDLMDARPELAASGVTWAWVHAQRQSAKALRAELPLAKTPVLAILTPNDPLINGPSQRVLPEKLPDCTVFEVPDARHEIYMETPEITRRVWQAIDRHIAMLRSKKLGL